MNARAYIVTGDFGPLPCSAPALHCVVVSDTQAAGIAIFSPFQSFPAPLNQEFTAQNASPKCQPQMLSHAFAVAQGARALQVKADVFVRGVEAQQPLERVDRLGVASE